VPSECSVGVAPDGSRRVGSLGKDKHVSRLDGFLDLVPPALHSESGEVFYSGRSAFANPAPVYLLGINPGGDPVRLSGFTIGSEIEAARARETDDWSAYSDEAWGGRVPGTHPYQRGVLHMFERCGLEPRAVAASNVVFARTRSASAIGDRWEELVNACWPVHEAVIDVLGVGVVVCLGGDAGRWVRRQLGADTEIDRYTETYPERRWVSTTHQGRAGIQVVTLTHPSRANWLNPLGDPSDLVIRALDRPQA